MNGGSWPSYGLRLSIPLSTNSPTGSCLCVRRGSLGVADTTRSPVSASSSPVARASLHRGAERLSSRSRLARMRRIGAWFQLRAYPAVSHASQCSRVLRVRYAPPTHTLRTPLRPQRDPQHGWSERCSRSWPRGRELAVGAVGLVVVVVDQYLGLEEAVGGVEPARETRRELRPPGPRCHAGSSTLGVDLPTHRLGSNVYR